MYLRGLKEVIESYDIRSNETLDEFASRMIDIAMRDVDAFRVEIKRRLFRLSFFECWETFAYLDMEDARMQYYHQMREVSDGE
jgi:hypothetical protein